MQGIVIVSNDSSFIGWARKALAPAGVQVTQHGKSNGIAVTVAEEQADLVVLDTRMLGLDTVMLSYFLKRWRPRLPLVIAARGSFSRLEVEAWQESADAWLAMPKAAAEFVETIKRHLPVPAWVALPSVGSGVTGSAAALSGGAALY